MPFGGLLSLGAAGVGLAGGIGSLINGTPASHVPTYSYGNMPGADANAITGTGNLGQYNIGAGYIPQYQQGVQNIINNPYASHMQQGANQTGALGQYAGTQLAGSSLAQLPDVQALLRMGFDPQQALYNRTRNQVEQQNLATLGNSGVANTPYGQSVVAQANNNFNIDWQNAQLQRALAGAQGAGNLTTNIAQNVGTGLNQATAGAALPYQTFQGINTDALSALSGGTQFGQQVSQIPQVQIGDYLSYLQGGTNQQGVNNQTAGLQFNQSQAVGNQIGGALAGLSKNPALNNWFGGNNSNWGQNNPGMAGSSYYGPRAA